MKRIIFLLTAVLMLLSLAACGKNDPAVGTWRLVQTESGASIVEHTEEDGINEFYCTPNGKLVMTVDDYVLEGSWSVEERKYTVEADQKYTATVEGDRMYLRVPRYTMTYERVSETYTEKEIPTYQLEGSWVFESIVGESFAVDYNEMAGHLGVELKDVSTTIVLQEGGKAYMETVDEVQEGSWSGTAEEATITFGENTLLATIQWGDLCIATTAEGDETAVMRYDRLSDAQELETMPQDATPVGTWQTHAVMSGGEVTVIADAAESYGTTVDELAAILVLNEDGTGNYGIDSDDMTVTWEKGERYFPMTMEGEECRGVFSNDKLMIFRGEDQVYVLVKK